MGCGWEDGPPMHQYMRASEMGEAEGSRTLTMRSEVSACGQRVSCASTCSRVTLWRSCTNSGLSASSTASSSSGGTCDGGETEEGSWTLPTDETKATISTPYASLRYFSAIAPAATLPTTRQHPEQEREPGART